MAIVGSRPIEKRTYPLDVLYLTLLISTLAIAGGVVLLGGPDSWFHRNRNAALSLLLGALAGTGLLNLRIGHAYGTIWMKSGPVYRVEHPKLFATQYSLTVIICFAAGAGVVALLFFLPPL